MVKRPKKVPYAAMLFAAHLMQLKSRFTKRPPMLLPHQVRSFYKNAKRYDTSKAARDLGFIPTPQIEVIQKTLRYFREEAVSW